MDKRKKKKEAKSITVLQNKQPGIAEDPGGGDDFTDHDPGVLHNTSGETDTLKVRRGPHQHEIEGSKATLVLGVGASNDQQKTKDEHRSFDSADLETLLETVGKQRDDMKIIKNSMEKHIDIIKRLTDAKDLGQCGRCVLQSSVKRLYPTDDVRELAEAVQCTEDVETTSKVVNIIVLLNDGKTMNLNSDFNRVDSGVQSGYESSVRVDDAMDDARTSGATSQSNGLYQPDGLGARGTVEESDGDTLRATDFDFDVNRQTHQMSICPICATAEFHSVEDLTMHIEGHFSDRQLSEDYAP